MNQLPPAPVDYYAPWRAAFVRPLAVSVIGWVGMVLGALGIICGGLALLMGQLMLARLNTLGGINTSWNVGQLAEALVGLAQSLVLLLGSLGSLYLRPAARWVMLGYAIFSIGWSIGMLLIQGLVSGYAPAPFRAVPMTAAMLAVGLIFSCAFPVAILIVMTRPHVRSAFANGGMTWYASSYAPPPPVASGRGDVHAP